MYTGAREFSYNSWKTSVDSSTLSSRLVTVLAVSFRFNTISRFTRLQPFDPYLCGWRNYSSLFRDNLAWMTAATIYIALVLTAMQVGLATEQLQGDTGIQRASYGFTIFAILGSICALGLVVLGALLNLVKDLPWLLEDKAVSARDGNPSLPV